MHVGGVSRVTDRAPTPGSEESEVPVQLQPMAATFKTRLRCSKLREALQEFVKLPLLAKVEFDYLDCSSDPTRSIVDIHSTILRDFAAKFKGALSTPVPPSEVSDLEDVAINCAESLVWKNLQSICEDVGCWHRRDSLHMIAKDLMWLLEDASHEVPLFIAADESPLRIWDIFVAAYVQKQRFCALAVYESVQRFTCGKTLVENAMTTRLWDTMLERFKSAELELAEHKMIDSQELEWKLDFFRDKLHELQRRWPKWALPTIFNEECFCSESCTGCGRSLFGVSRVWIAIGKSGPIYPHYPQSKGRKPFHDEFRFQHSLQELTKLMSDLTDAASKIANSLPAPKPSEDAESSQDSSLGSWDKVVSSPSSIASTSKQERCTKLREALQEFVKLALLAKVEFGYVGCSSDPTRSMLDIHSTILRDFAAKFKGALSTRVPPSEVSDLEDVAINCAESLVWKNLQSICEDARCCKGTASLCMIAKDLMWLLEDASHEVPLFVDAEANLRIWEVFVAANVQKQRFCALAVYEKQIRKQYTREKTVVESLMTTRLWDTMLVRFKRAQFHLAEHEMIDSDLQSQLKEFRDILSSVRSNLNLPASSLSCLTKLMSDLTAAASKIASSLPAPNPSEDAEGSQESSMDQADQETLRPDESASQVGDGSATSDSCTLVSAVGGPHCFLPGYLFQVPGQVEETSFISGKDTGEENIVDDDEE